MARKKQESEYPPDATLSEMLVDIERKGRDTADASERLKELLKYAIAHEGDSNVKN